MYESLIIWLTKPIRRGLLAVDSDAVLLRCAPSVRANPLLGVHHPLGNPHEKTPSRNVMAFLFVWSLGGCMNL